MTDKNKEAKNGSETLRLDSKTENLIIFGIEKSGMAASPAVETAPEAKREFSSVFARLKKSARKKSVSIL